MHTGEGLHRFVDPVDEPVYLYTQFEVADARRVFACFDQPDLKATFTFTVTAPDALAGRLQRADPGARAGSATGTAALALRRRPRAMSTYITALVAGAVPRGRRRRTYGAHGDRSRSALYCRAVAGRAPRRRRDLRGHQAGLRRSSSGRSTRPTRSRKYDQLFVPEFNAGAMENAGCVTFREDYIFRSQVADARLRAPRQHDPARDGAHVVRRPGHHAWWDDLWLNESFAEWACTTRRPRRPSSPTPGPTSPTPRKTWAYRQDQLPSTHPIAADIPDLEAVEVNFDGITYAKGASVLKQLVAWVGLRRRSSPGCARYFDEHACGNTDVRRPARRAGGDLRPRPRRRGPTEWLQTAGVNTLRPSSSSTPTARFTSFAVVQDGARPTTRRCARTGIAIGLYDRADGGLVRRAPRRARRRRARAPRCRELVGERAARPAAAQRRRPDLRQDPARRALAGDAGRPVIGDLDDSLARALCWGAAWDMTRDAEMSATRLRRRSCCAASPSETDIVASCSTLLRQAETAVDLYVRPRAPRGQARLRLADGAARGCCATAEPGSDHQLALARAFAGARRPSDEQLDLVRGAARRHARPSTAWPSTPTCAGTCCTGWSRPGAPATPRSTPSWTRDDTADRPAAGRGRARAPGPTAEAKAEAWASVVEQRRPAERPPDRDHRRLPRTRPAGPAAAVRRPLLRLASAQVWDDADQRDGAEHRDRPVPDAARRASDRRTRPTPGSTRVTPTPLPALRRLVAEARDGVARALRAQARDASD